MTKYDNSVVNECVPRTGNRVTRGFSQLILRAMGWQISGALPKEKKIVFIGCPHTSNWDLLLALSAMQAIGLKASWMMKKEVFFWPVGRLWKKLGGVPIDRKAKNDITTQMADWFVKQDKAYLGITPEGTRAKVEQFKKGYLRIAYAAKVPVFLVGIDSVKKEVVLDKIWPLTGDIETDNRAIKKYYDENYVGIRPNLS